MVAMNAMYYVASTLPLGDSGVTSNTVLFVPRWGGEHTTTFAPNDVVCLVGSANSLDPNIASWTAVGGGTDCTAANGCGVHIHSGTDCADKDTQGGHWYDTKDDTEDTKHDPWAHVGYDSTDALGHGPFAACVHTGFDVASDPSQLVGKAFVVHASDGSRVSCGLIAAAPEGYAPKTLTAATVPIPIPDASSTATGTVEVLADLREDVPDGVCYMGYATGLEADVESYLLGTGSPQCNVTNGCGAHIHAGTGCDDKDAQGGHYYDAAALAGDPWAHESYYETDGAGNAALIGCIIAGHGARDYDSLPFIVHNTDGGRLLCGLLEGEDEDSSDESSGDPPGDASDVAIVS